MSDDFLKRELEAEAKASSKRKRITLLSVTLLMITGVFILGTWQTAPASDDTIELQTTDNSPSGNGDNTANPDQAAQDSTPSTSSLETPRTSQPQQSTLHTYSPAPIPVNKAAFVADASTMLANYGHIVNLVTFTPGMSDAEKTNRIKQAYSLSGSSNQVTLRTHLVSAEISSGPYVEATELAERGIAAICVGLIFMDYWADDHSRTSNLQTGLGGVTEGVQALLGLPDKLNRL